MQDIMTPIKNSYLLNSILKNSSIETIENCGHFHIHERSDNVRKLINNYIES